MARTKDTTALLKTLHAVSLTEARDYLLELDNELQVLPTRDRDALVDTVEQIITATHEAKRSTIGELIDAHRDLLTAMTGVPKPNLTAFQREETVQELDRCRNLMLALAMVGCLHLDANPEAVVTEFVHLKGSNKTEDRAYRDDEILLLRLWNLGMARHGDARAKRSAATYAETEIGMVPGETAYVAMCDLDIEDITDAHVQVSPTRDTARLNSRILRAHRLPAHLMATHRATLKPGTGQEFFTYQPRARKANGDAPARTGWREYAARQASVSGVLDNMRRALGIQTNDTTASSIYRWRVETAYHHDGLAGALEVSGCQDLGKLEALLRLNQPEDKDSARHTEITSFDLDDVA